MAHLFHLTPELGLCDQGPSVVGILVCQAPHPLGSTGSPLWAETPVRRAQLGHPKEASTQDALSCRNCSCFKHTQSPVAMQELKKVNWNLQVSLDPLFLLSRMGAHAALSEGDSALVYQPGVG